MEFLFSSILTWAEAALSGCSVNPARSFAQALIAGNITDHWVYWIAPLIGVSIVALFFRWRWMNCIY